MTVMDVHLSIETESSHTPGLIYISVPDTLNVEKKIASLLHKRHMWGVVHISYIGFSRLHIVLA